MTLTPIAFARNGFTDKFGIPRQVREQTSLRTRIVFCPPYRSEDAIRGIEAFTHLWLLWGFHEATPKQSAVSNQQSAVSGLIVRKTWYKGSKYSWIILIFAH